MMQSSIKMLSLIRSHRFRNQLIGRTLASRTLALQKDLPYHLVVGLPALSPTMESGALAEWYLQEGDSFAAGDGLAKIETDKAAMDFEAQDDGFVAKILVPASQGNDIPIGTPIMITVEDAADVAAFKDYISPIVSPPASPVIASSEPAAAAVDVAIPKAATPSPVVVSSPPVSLAAAVVAHPPAPVIAVAAAAAAAPTVPVAATTTWGRYVVDTSPLAKTLAAEQNAYLAKYGTTGQSPILASS